MSISKEIQDTLREYFTAPVNPSPVPGGYPTFLATPPNTPAPQSYSTIPWMNNGLEFQRRASMPALQFQRRGSVIFPGVSTGTMSNPFPPAPVLPKDTWPSPLYQLASPTLSEEQLDPCQPSADVFYLLFLSRYFSSIFLFNSRILLDIWRIIYQKHPRSPFPCKTMYVASSLILF